MASFGVAYRLSGQGFSIRNISGVSKKVRVDLSKIFAGWKDCHGASSAVYTLAAESKLHFLKAFHSGKGTVEMKNSLSLLARQSAGPVFFESIAS